MTGTPSDPPPVYRGKVPPRKTLPSKKWTPPPRTAAELKFGAIYTLEPDEEMVYASSVMDEWYLTGRDRLFSVAENGVVTEITEGVDDPPALTLNDFSPEPFFMRRCPEDGALDDWHHREVHD